MEEYFQLIKRVCIQPDKIFPIFYGTFSHPLFGFNPKGPPSDHLEKKNNEKD